MIIQFSKQYGYKHAYNYTVHEPATGILLMGYSCYCVLYVALNCNVS